jgi:16S rRNA (cytidine1402-2'-O)-methyltransferase
MSSAKPSSPSPEAALSVVATPIGNLGDITLRALETLRGCDLILAEDTRTTRALCAAHHIDRPLARLDDHASPARVEELVSRLAAGERMALVSDAGTPLVSDPGAMLVRAALDAGVAVQCLPGASAALAALVLSGLGGGGFRFVAFLPREGVARKHALAAIARDPLPTVLYESPERAPETLRDLAAVCGDDRRASVSREITKRFEETLRGTLGELCAKVTEALRGEVAMVIDGQHQDEAATVSDLDAALDHCLAAGMRPSEAAREVARALGMKRADVYARALARAGEREG